MSTDTLLAMCEAIVIDALGSDGALDGADLLLAQDCAAPLRDIAETFVLEADERRLLILLLAAAGSAAVGQHISAHGGTGSGVPVWLAGQLIPGLRRAAWSSSGALRRFGLIDVTAPASGLDARLALREAIVDRACGLAGIDPLVAGRIAPLGFDEPAPDALVAALATALRMRAGGLSPAITADSTPQLLAAALTALGLKPRMLSAADLPADPELRDELARCWSRDAALDRAALIVTDGERDPIATAAFAGRVMGHVLLTGVQANAGLRRGVHPLVSPATTPAAASERWVRALGRDRARKLGVALPRIASQFRPRPAEIDALCARMAPAIDAAEDGVEAARLLWHEAARLPLSANVPGVTLVEPVYVWDDIVLPQGVEAALRRIETHVRHATMVLDDWGFARARGGRGRGVAALLSGPSGTGKTMAAEVLASALDLRMLMIDLSQIISKYVGETSKNIAAAFDQAERTGAVMVWNEGDAVWGTRGSVGNATDRHVNAEIGDLLQRMEAFRGFTIVTTNLKHAIDPAFLRRFRFTVDFPMPAREERVRLWQRAFPPEAPVDTIDWARLADLPLSGGSISNIALGSAFVAAEQGDVIGRRHIAAELAEELRKQNQPVPVLDWGTA